MVSAAAATNDNKGEGIQLKQPPVLQKPPAYRTSSAPPPHPIQYPRRPPFRREATPLPQSFRRVGGGGKRQCRSVCCRVFCFTAIFGVILAAIAGGAAYLYVQPQAPSFRVQAVRVPRLNVTTKADGSGSYVDSDVVVRIFARNPNGKMSVDYGPDSEAAVYAVGVDHIHADDDQLELEEDEYCVGSGAMVMAGGGGGLLQGTRNATVMEFAVRGRGNLVADADGERIRSGMRTGSLKLRVHVRTSIKFNFVAVGRGGRIKSTNVSTGRIPIRVECPPATVNQLASKVARGFCRIHWFNK